MLGMPLWPLAKPITVSLVLISPSMVIRLKEVSTASSSDFWKHEGLILASVVTKQSIVAMLGQIMPAPLAHAPMRTRWPPISRETAISFLQVSLVMMACATSSPLLVSRPATSAPIFGSMRIIGIGRPMTPVEHIAICR